MGEEVKSIGLTATEDINKWRLNLLLYDFDITLEDLQEMLVKREEPLILQRKTKATPYYSSNEELVLVSASKIIMNKRGTLKLVVWSDGMFSMFNREAKPVSSPMTSIPYNYEKTEIWDDLKEGMYVAFCTPWSRSQSIALLTDCYTRKDAEKWLAVYTECMQKRTDYRAFEEMDSLTYIPAEGMLTLSNLEKHREAMDKKIAEIQALEAQEQILKETALATRITITQNKITIDALDEHKYHVTVPKMLWTPQDWVDFVYRHRYNWKQHNQESVKEHTLFYSVLERIVASKPEWFELSMDDKPSVRIAIKEITNKKGQRLTLAYLNEKRVAYGDMTRAIYEYYVNGKPLTALTEVPEDLDETKKQEMLEMRKQREEVIVSQGITGYIEDLEGEFPITLGFEKTGNNWYLTIGEKKIHLKGGTETIRSLERVLKGTAQDYQARHSTEELYRRLCRILTPEEALEVITEAKQLGKLVQAIDSKK